MHTSDNSKKILAVASLGGHWVQLLRIVRSLEDKYEIDFLCTDGGAAAMVGSRKLYVCNDFSRWNPLKMIPAAFSIFRTIRRSRPDVIISTGAAPGLIAIALGRLVGCRTLWIDSVANAATLSGSGRMACRVAHKVFTQWPELASDKVEYHGNIFG